MWKTIRAKIKALWLESWTKVWAYVQGVMAVAATMLVDPGVKMAISGFHMDAKWVMVSALATFAAITYLAHGHKADK